MAAESDILSIKSSARVSETYQDVMLKILDVQKDISIESKSLTAYATLPADLPPDCTSLIACVMATYVCHFHTQSLPFSHRHGETIYSR
jgi:hypothetical protein